jgi:hypothetical protein
MSDAKADFVRPPRTNSRSGGRFTAGLVLAVLVLVPAGWFGWREWESRQRGTNERRAAAVLCLLSVCEDAFFNQDLDRNGAKDFWTGDVAGLLARTAAAPLVPDGEILEDRDAIARADPARADAEPYYGFWFVPIELDAGGAPYRVNGQPRNPEKYAFCAYPAHPGRSGRALYIINEQHQVFKHSDFRARPSRWPSENELKQWPKI